MKSENRERYIVNQRYNNFLIPITFLRLEIPQHSKYGSPNREVKLSKTVPRQIGMNMRIFSYTESLRNEKDQSLQSTLSLQPKIIFILRTPPFQSILEFSLYIYTCLYACIPLASTHTRASYVSRRGNLLLTESLSLTLSLPSGCILKVIWKFHLRGRSLARELIKVNISCGSGFADTPLEFIKGFGSKNRARGESPSRIIYLHPRISHPSVRARERVI